MSSAYRPDPRVGYCSGDLVWVWVWVWRAAIRRPVILVGVIVIRRSRSPPAHGRECVPSFSRYTWTGSVAVCAVPIRRTLPPPG